MLEVGTNTYVSREYADEYITSRYKTNNEDRNRWRETPEEDKEILLISACDELNNLQWQGRTAVKGQAMAFPRLPFQYGKTDEIAPLRVKQAQVELALWLSDDTRQSKLSKRQELQSQGVESFSIGDLSESYGKGVGEKPAPLLCSKVKALIAPYLSGGYDIC